MAHQLVTFTVEEVEAAIGTRRRIGAGGSAEVFAITLRGNQVAAKRIAHASTAPTLEDGTETDFGTFFRREVDQLGRAPRHPNIVRLVGFTPPGPSPHVYLLYELMPLGDLSAHLTGPGALGEWDRVQVPRATGIE